MTFPRTQLSVTVVGRRNQSIGEGAFSTVYQATDRQSPNRHYALKRMLLQSSDLTNMAKVEVDAYHKFFHPHIIQLVDHIEKVESTTAVMYLLFPYCQRGSLRDDLNRIMSGSCKKPSVSRMLRNFIDICEAIQVLHDFQPSYVHFDIKPEVIHMVCSL